MHDVPQPKGGAHEAVDRAEDPDAGRWPLRSPRSALGACGADNKSSSSGSAATAYQDRSSGRWQEGRHADVPSRRRHRLHRSGPGLLHVRLHDRVRHATARCTRSSPTTRSSAVPDLASGPPEISADNKTITVKIRKGIKYSPPVNREVTSKDVKYAIERAFSKNVPSGYAGAYFSSIEGAPTAGAGPIKDISGLADAGRPHAGHQAQGGAGSAGLPGARDADHRAGAQGVRGAVRRQDAVDLRPVRRPSPARTWSRTTRAASSPGASRAS